MELARKMRSSVRFQRFIGWISFPILGPIIVMLLRGKGYSVAGHSRHRDFFRASMKDTRPLLICSNHLTMIDSVILQWAFGSIGSYLVGYRQFPWNVPAREVFASRWYYRLVIFLTKCIPIDRTGSKEHHEEVIQKMEYILRLGDPFIVFPEGGRSRRGTFDLDNLTYGIGRIIKDIGDCRVLCVYLRGHLQERYTSFPPEGSRFSVLYEIIEPRTEEKGIRGERDLATQVGMKIKELEARWFDANPSLTAASSR
jgi:1-acyl-sn-glycerol-3-phosphate acyltransferase